MDKKIQKIDFIDALIITTTTDGKQYYRHLYDFPLLWHATDSQRQHYAIGKWGDDVRWGEIDEDVHISSLTRYAYNIK